MRIVICQRCGCERGPRGGAGPLYESPAGRELLGSVEQVGEAVQHPTRRPGLKEASRGPPEAPGATPSLVCAKSAGSHRGVDGIPCCWADLDTYDSVRSV